MGKGLELYESRVNRVDSADGVVMIHFSHAVIYNAKGLPGRDPGTAWSQEAVLLLEDAAMLAPEPTLPNQVTDGFVEIDGERFEIIPVPLGARMQGRVHLEFVDGSILEVAGRHPAIVMQGHPVRLQGFP